MNLGAAGHRRSQGATLSARAPGPAVRWELTAALRPAPRHPMQTGQRCVTPIRVHLSSLDLYVPRSVIPSLVPLPSSSSLCCGRSPGRSTTWPDPCARECNTSTCSIQIQYRCQRDCCLRRFKLRRSIVKLTTVDSDSQFAFSAMLNCAVQKEVVRTRPSRRSGWLGLHARPLLALQTLPEGAPS